MIAIKRRFRMGNIGFRQMNIPIINLTIYLMVGLAGGLLGLYSRLPAGTMLGAVLAVVALKYYLNVSWVTPKMYGFICQVCLGVLIALTYSPGMFKKLGSLFIPMAISTVALILWGIVIALLLAKYWSLDLPTSYIATSPGGMSALVPMSVDMNVNPILIASFHFFRIFLVVLTAPVIIKIILVLQQKYPS
jgi:membrane AbrB-like protein